MIITLLKAIHIMALLLWTAGLLSLPLMLARHEEGEHQFRYARIRKFTHYSYTRLVTPAAVIAIAAGTPLIFLRGMFVPWLFAKLALVAMLVAARRGLPIEDVAPAGMLRARAGQGA